MLALYHLNFHPNFFKSLRLNDVPETCGYKNMARSLTLIVTELTTTGTTITVTRTTIDLTVNKWASLWEFSMAIIYMQGNSTWKLLWYQRYWFVQSIIKFAWRVVLILTIWMRNFLTIPTVICGSNDRNCVLKRWILDLWEGF